ncbi:hypothetical protein EDB19DRAFT_1761471 [Suillus lakei]|nr:hypothetical protein EDB19DRAFT_1761471 [Suillus lakei]
MLEPDGRIACSTCSLNPVENEAVIAAALNSSPVVGAGQTIGHNFVGTTINHSITTIFKTCDAYNESLTEDQ